MNTDKTYRINEVFCSLQGEGHRAGTANIFVRFSGCNLTCAIDSAEENSQFDCDTEFTSGRSLTAAQIVTEIKQASELITWLIFTGGEPTLQLDDELLRVLRLAGYKFAIETNGTNPIPAAIDFVTVSPKTAEHALRADRADELKYVRHYGQGIPRPVLKAKHKFISPAWNADGLHTQDLQWCINLVKENPEWRLSIQQHKILRVR